MLLSSAARACWPLRSQPTAKIRELGQRLLWENLAVDSQSALTICSVLRLGSLEKRDTANAQMMGQAVAQVYSTAEAALSCGNLDLVLTRLLSGL